MFVEAGVSSVGLGMVGVGAVTTRCPHCFVDLLTEAGSADTPASTLLVH